MSRFPLGHDADIAAITVSAQSYNVITDHLCFGIMAQGDGMTPSTRIVVASSSIPCRLGVVFRISPPISFRGSSLSAFFNQVTWHYEASDNSFSAIGRRNNTYEVSGAAGAMYNKEVARDTVAAAFLLEAIITEGLKAGIGRKEDHICFGSYVKLVVYVEIDSKLQKPDIVERSILQIILKMSSGLFNSSYCVEEFRCFSIHGHELVQKAAYFVTRPSMMLRIFEVKGRGHKLIKAEVRRENTVWYYLEVIFCKVYSSNTIIVYPESLVVADGLLPWMPLCPYPLSRSFLEAHHPHPKRSSEKSQCTYKQPDLFLSSSRNARYTLSPCGTCRCGSRREGGLPRLILSPSPLPPHGSSCMESCTESHCWVVSSVLSPFLLASCFIVTFSREENMLDLIQHCSSHGMDDPV
ncbi:hypothetical protein MUK42_32644 [Musa troglodytarum]|uniref:Uncharacterized protein n=1 Tax=Musa troglodytarum TaxID=320322 RepID=A0A9E7L758_9LILI|nr:hypothetical protein MUK42_32644 [Musa troglodytarum]